MASGKSLELAQIAPHPSPKCICGAAFDSHMRKDGKGVLKKFDDGKHFPISTSPWNRKARRHYHG